MSETVYIGFTGHRDCRTTDTALDIIAGEYPDAVWVHGGAEGFDTQVQTYAIEQGLPKPVVIRPDYKALSGKYAPLKRNETIVDMSILLVACYNPAMKRGGTFHTINYAKRRGVPIMYVECLPIAA